MYTSILVPLDASRFAEKALATAVAVARRANADLCLAAVEISPAFIPAGYPLEAPEDMAKKYMNEMADRVRDVTGLTVTTEVVAGGSVAEALEAVRTKVGAGLVVMSTHGRTGVSHALLGSVVEKIVRLSPVPVLTLNEAKMTSAV